MRTRLARVVSIIGHPFATMLLVAVVGAIRAGGDPAPILVGAGIVVPLAVLVGSQRRSGRWRTVDASERHERPVLYLVAGIAVGTVLAVVLLRDDRSVARWTGGVALIFAVAASLNRRIKVSLHMAFAAFAGVSLVALSSRAGWAVLAALPVLAWSRLHLQRHTSVELVVGTALGAAAAALVVATP